MNILITGVSGFVGRNLSSHLLHRGEFVVFGHSRNPSAQLELNQKIKFLNEITATHLNETKIDTIVHLAGIAHDLSSQYTTEDYFRVNFEGTRDTFDAFLQSDARKFVFVSSIKAVCDVSSLPADELMTPSPKTDYGKSKRKAEEYILSRSMPPSKRVYILRPAMMHGAGNKGNLNLLYRFAKMGLPFPFGSFHNQRSFHSIENFNFVIQSILEKDIRSGIYHLADDGLLSTTELFKLIGDSMSKKVRVLNLPQAWIRLLARGVGKADMVNKLTEDMVVFNKKIIDAIGAMPISLREGLTRTIKSFNGNK